MLVLYYGYQRISLPTFIVGPIFNWYIQARCCRLLDITGRGSFEIEPYTLERHRNPEGVVLTFRGMHRVP